MKVRVRKKMYREVVRAKAELGNLLTATCGDIGQVLADGYLTKVRKSRRGAAIRKVASTCSFYRGWKGWQVFLPTTREAMSANAGYGTILVFGQLYRGHHDSGPEEDIRINLRDLAEVPDYYTGLSTTPTVELVDDLIDDLFKGIIAPRRVTE